MMNEDLKDALSASEKMSQSLLKLENKVFPWADRKEKLYKTYFKELNQHREIVEDLSEDWILLTSNQFAAGKIFGSPQKLKKFLNQNRQSLTPDEKRIIRFFMENPWFYSLFSVEESIGKNFFRIYDYSSNRSLLLHSEGISQMHREGIKLFLCLLFNNGECHQTYGLLNYFRGFNVRDIKFFAGFTSFHFEKTGDLSLSISYNPIPYILLYRFADLPVAVNKNEPVSLCCHSLEVESFSPGKYKKTFTIKEKGGIFKLTRKGKKGLGSVSNIYYDGKKQTLLLCAPGLKEYQSLVETLDESYDFPAEPSWNVGIQMVVALEAILGVESPVRQYDFLFAEEPDPAAKEQLERLNAMIAEMSEKHNFGRDYSLEEMAQKYDFPLETVKQVRADLSRVEEKFKIDIQGGFADFTPPPPADRLKFKGTFRQNSLFEFRSGAAAEALFKIKQPGLWEVMEEFDFETLTLTELPELIEELFDSSWNGRECAILLYTMYLLSKKGKRFERVRDYAIEFLKIFWQIILPSKSREQLHGFIEEYAIFCFDVLYRVGLIDIDRELDEVRAMKADYKMKASDFFYRWIRFISSH